MPISNLEALAATLGLEYEGRSKFVNEYSYQKGRHVDSIYTDGCDYYCAQLKKPKSVVGKDWQVMSDDFWAKQANTKIWRSQAN